MKKMFAAILLGAGLAAFASTALADDSLRLRVSHEFSVGATTLPAGAYSLWRTSSEASQVLLIRSDDGRFSTYVVPVTSEWNSAGNSQFTFAQSGDSYRLTGIETPTGVYTLRPPRGKGSFASGAGR